MVFTSEVTTSHHIYETVSLAAFLEVSFDWLIRTFSVAFDTANASHTYFARFEGGMVKS